MATNFTNFKDGIEIVPKTTSTVSSAGDIDFDTTANKLNLHNGTISSPIVTEASTATLTNKTINASSNTITNIANTNISSSAAIDASKIANGTVSSTEFQFLDGVTSSIQTQLNTISGSSITSLTGDVSATGPGASAATVNLVGGSSAANVHAAELLANAATSSNTASTIVRRDGSKNTHLSGLQLDGSTSGTITLQAADTTTSYSIKWPNAQGTSGQVLTDDGSGNLFWTSPAAAGANTALSNLVSTAVNQDLSPNVDASVDLGTSSKRWRQLNVSQLISFANKAQLETGASSPSGISGTYWDTTGSGVLGLFTQSAASTSNLQIETGNASGGNSGSIIFQTGTATGTRGGITLNGNGLTLNQISTPASPAANFNKLYFKSDNNLYVKNSAGTESVVAAVSPIRSEVVLKGGVGHGATATKIRLFVDPPEKNVGSDISYAFTFNLGTTFTINTDGLYAISYSDSSGSSGDIWGISKNSSSLTTSIEGLAAAQIVCTGIVPTANRWTTISAVLFLQAGDIIRAQDEGSMTETSDYRVVFRIIKIGN